MHWDLVAGNLDFHKDFFHLWVIFWVSDLQGLLHHSQEGLSRFMGGCRIYSQDRCLCILANAHVGDISGFLGIWCYSPQLLEKHFYPWMDVKLLLGRRRDTNERCLILPCCWYNCQTSFCIGCFTILKSMPTTVVSQQSNTARRKGKREYDPYLHEHFSEVEHYTSSSYLLLTKT